jgi:hypothetical protein
MATNTTNYNWTKPDYEDDADIKDLNDNFDGIDAQVKAIDDQVQLNKNNISYNTNQGVKNIFRTPTIDTTNSGINVKTLSDGQLKVTSAGTNTSAVYIDLETSIGSKYVGYKLSGGSANVGVYISNSGGTVACSVRGDEVSIPSNATNKLFLTINANTPAFEETIYVMIREIGDSTYQPYALSNAELTAKEQTNENNISLRPEVLVRSVTNITATTTLEDTGVSYTIPSGAYVRITATARYGQSNPEEIMIWTGSSVFAHTVAITGDNNFALTATTLIGGISGATTAKIYARFRSANTNAIILEVESVPNPN